MVYKSMECNDLQKTNPQVPGSGGNSTTLLNGMWRKLCIVCKKRVGAKYIKNMKKGRMVYYRSKCWECAVTNLVKMNHRIGTAERYAKNGYNLEKSQESHRKKHIWVNYKKSSCEKCGFIPEHSCQLDVDHIDGNKMNNNPSNFQTLCANCHRLKTHINKENGGWKLNKIIMTTQKIFEFNKPGD